MRKKLLYLFFWLLLLASCEEYYKPAIDQIEGQLVIEAFITNDQSRNFVRLTKTRNFYSVQPSQVVSGARVELIEINGKITQGIEISSGNFTFNTLPVIGKNYKLRVLLLRDIYESEVVSMPPLPSIVGFYTGHIVEKVYVTDGYGSPHAFDVPQREIYIDAPVSDKLSHYRFSTRTILEWIYNPPSITGPPPPSIYGWQSFYQNEKFNLAGPKKFSQTEKIEKYPLLKLYYNASAYLQTDTLFSNGWIIIIDQFGTSEGSYEFHKNLNSQFAADGSLFDPVQTQIFGNITCTSDPSKIVFGYFDLNSYRQYRYYLYISNSIGPGIPRQIFRYPIIPDTGKTVGMPPDWWE